MNCARVAELLPWFLNRTLESVERQAVEEHLESCEACRHELQETVFVARAASEHLPTEALVDYAFEGEVDSIDRELVEAHLAHCESCREKLEMARETRRLAAADEDSEPSVTPPRRTAAAPRDASVPSPVKPAWRYFALAASFASLVLAGGWLKSFFDTEELRSRLESGESALVADFEQRRREIEERLASVEAEREELRLREARLEEELAVERLRNDSSEPRPSAFETPQLNVLIADVFAADEIVRQGGTSENELEIRAGAESMVVLSLYAVLDSTFEEYEIELSEAAGRRLWEATGLEPTADGYFTLALPASSLKEGGFLIRVFGRGAGERTEVARYPISVRRPL